MSKPTTYPRLSTEAMRLHADNAADRPVIIALTDHRITFTATGRARMEQILNDTCAAIVYSDFFTPDGNGTNFNTNRLIKYQTGSLRDDFDFGHIVAVNPAMLRQAVSEITDNSMPPDGTTSVFVFRALGKSYISLKTSIQRLQSFVLTTRLAKKASSAMSIHATVPPR